MMAVCVRVCVWVCVCEEEGGGGGFKIFNDAVFEAVSFRRFKEILFW